MKYQIADINKIDNDIKKLIDKNRQVVEYEQYGQPAKKVVYKKGLFLYGVTGSGKTYTLDAIHRSLRTGGNSLTSVENWVEILLEIKDRMAQRQSSKLVIDNITEKDFVFIDDVGAEKSTEWVQETLYSIIDRCYRQDKTLFITTNLTTSEFSQRYGERLLSRLVEMCEAYEMKSVDKRITN